MSKEELYILCCLKLRERELYRLNNVVTSIEELEVTTKGSFHKEDLDQAKTILTKMKKFNIKVCAFFEKEYPSILKEIPYYPPFLFYIGSYEEENKLGLGVVGSRDASLKGKQLTEKLVTDLKDVPVSIISGMAAGIDTIAHQKAIEVGLKTIAVLGSGIDIIYPASNKQLYKTISEKGVIFSEYLPGTPPMSFNFPKRNRIISGLSKAVVVVEAGQKSGSLITARYAMEHNRELFVYPRTPVEKNSDGNNNLIKLGAKIITSAEDIIKDFFPNATILHSEKQIKLTDDEKKIYSNISSEPINIDTLCFLLDIGPSTLANFLLILELKGLVKELPGKFYVRA